MLEQRPSRKTLLHITVENSAEDVLDLLLDHIKCIDAVDDKGFTPLMVASRNGKDAAIDQLLA
ncbi:hypothetical protein F442_10722 [Phytophthora nicotianae P10297]|uniref:Uncharacterized protein n=1 Tax=Phytophthora nicotianae P10297 TaxID=1317064 RepID=W2Z5L4_PHYNI|nr:hypothetical protein F442_10722 [Phytophthora nicotianae P10297]